MTQPKEKNKEKTYHLSIEGVPFEWHKPTITPEEIAELGGWDAAIGVIEIDEKDQSERTLQPGEVIELKPGKSFGKKISWKRG
jgi:hypothetical protein